MAEGFLGRWSQRKQAARAGRPVQEVEAAPVPDPVSQDTAKRETLAPTALAANRRPVAEPHTDTGTGTEAPAPEAPPPPSMQDVAALHSGSDFKPFVSRAVAPEVRNAAMKKLFADPHFNVMDGLDTYIDDYSLPDPLPESMLRKMASAKFMNLFDDEDEADSVAQAAATTGGPGEARGHAATGDAGPVAADQALAQSTSPPKTNSAAAPDKPEPDVTDLPT